MSDKNERIAESIIRTEVSDYAHARMDGRGAKPVLEVRAALKERLIHELDLAEGRGANP